MPSVQYYNNTAPFWDWIASMEDQHNSNNNAARGQEASSEGEQPANPWMDGWAGFPFGGPLAHRPRGGHASHHAHGYRHHHERPGPPAEGDDEPEAGPSKERSDSDTNEEPQRPGHGRHGHRGPGGRGDPRMRGGRGGFGGCGRGGFGGRGRGHHFYPYAHMGGPFGAFAQMFQENLFGGEESGKNSTEDFKPEADVFDTLEAFIIHVSLPGAKKEDVGVNWESDKSELSIAGVTYRPGDEEFLKTLAMDERKVGPFERKIRLGSRAKPAQVDVEGITARLEDGVLTVEVPKLGEDEFVEVKKVDIA